MRFNSRTSSRRGKGSPKKLRVRRQVKAMIDRREKRLLDLGGFTLMLYRQGKITDRLLSQKAAEVAAIEDEIQLVEQHRAKAGEPPAAPPIVQEAVAQAPLAEPPPEPSVAEPEPEPAPEPGPAPEPEPEPLPPSEPPQADSPPPDSDRAAAALRAEKAAAADEQRAAQGTRPGLIDRIFPGEGDGVVDLNGATFEELRGIGMSVTQAKRTLAYRDERGGFSSTEDLNEVPGFPIDFLAKLKRRTTV